MYYIYIYIFIILVYYIIYKDFLKWQRPFPPDAFHEVTKNGVHGNFAFEAKV